MPELDQLASTRATGADQAGVKATDKLRSLQVNLLPRSDDQREDHLHIVTSRLHHIGIGRTHAGTCVILLIQDLNIRVVNAITGELLRELTLNPHIDYQPTGAPKGPTRKPRK